MKLNLVCMSGGERYTTSLLFGVNSLHGSLWSTLTNGKGKRGLGVHVWKKELEDGNVLVFDVLISNAAVYPDPVTKAPVFGGMVHFEALTIQGDINSRVGAWRMMAQLREGESVENGWFGTTYRLVRPGRHVFPPRFSCVRRFVIYKRKFATQAAEALNGRHLATRERAKMPIGAGRYDNCNDSTHRHDAQGMLRQLLAGAPFAYWGRQESDGTITKVPQEPCGLFWGYGNVRDQQEQGGQGIFLSPGAELQSTAQILGWRTIMDLTIERSPIAMFNGNTGYPLDRSEVNYPNEYFLTRAKELDFFTVPDEDWNRVYNFGAACAYANELKAQKAPDDAHSPRLYGPAIQPAHYGDGPARAWLDIFAHDVMFSHSMVRIPQTSPYENLSLPNDYDNAVRYEGKGGRVLRQEAHATRGLLEAFAVVKDPVLAQRYYDWTQLKLKIWELWQNKKNGCMASIGADDGLYQNEPWQQFGLARNKRAFAPWEFVFTLLALDCAEKLLPEEGTGDLVITKRRIRTMIDKALNVWRTGKKNPYGETGGLSGLGRYAVSAVDDIPVEKIIETVGPPRNENYCVPWAIGKRLGLDVSAIEPVIIFDARSHAVAWPYRGQVGTI